MIKKSQEGWRNELEYVIRRLKEVEVWIDSEEDPEIKQEMISEINYLTGKVLDAIKMSFGGGI